jgi:hypothetical protein
VVQDRVGQRRLVIAARLSPLVDLQQGLVLTQIGRGLGLFPKQLKLVFVDGQQLLQETPGLLFLAVRAR